MKEILITALLLGCFITFTSADRGLFEFHDSYGRCWRCLPGQACVRCPGNSHPFVNEEPPTWDLNCGEPTSEYCDQFLGVKFPSTDMSFYWICSEEGVFLASCPCDTVFQYRGQKCVATDEITSISCNPDVYCNNDPWGCGDDTSGPSEPCFGLPVAPTPAPPPGPIPTAPTEEPSIPTAPTAEPTQLPPTDDPNSSPPTAPTDPPPTDPPAPTITTEAGGPGATQPTTTTDDDTTPAPCVCVVWWPCWCNPCWNMPCHSCNGCVGMMG